MSQQRHHPALALCRERKAREHILMHQLRIVGQYGRLGHPASEQFEYIADGNPGATYA